MTCLHWVHRYCHRLDFPDCPCYKLTRFVPSKLTVLLPLAQVLFVLWEAISVASANIAAAALGASLA